MREVEDRAETQGSVGVVGIGYVGLVTAVCFAHLGHHVVCLDVDEAKIEALRAGRRADLRARSRRSSSPTTRDRLSFTTSYDELCSSAATSSSSPSTRRRRRRATPTCRASQRAVREIARARRRATARHEEHGAGGHRRDASPPNSRPPGVTGIGYVSNPEFLREGAAIDDFLRARPHRDRRLPREPTATTVAAAVPPASTRRRAHQRAHRRDDQVRLQRLPGHQDLVHQRDRQRLRGRSAPTCAPWRDGMGLDHRIGPHFLQAGIGYGGSCFPKDVQALKQLAGNTGYHFQLLNAVIEVNAPAEAARGRQAQGAAGPACAASTVALLGPHLQAATPTTCARRPPSCSPAACTRGRPRHGLRPDGRRPASTRSVPRRRRSATSALEALDGADAAVLVTEWPEFVAPRLERRPRAHARPLAHRRPQLRRPRRASPRPGFEYDGIGRATNVRPAPVTSNEAEVGQPGRRHPRALRPSSSSAVRARGCVRSPRACPSRSCRWSSGRSSPTSSTTSRGTAWSGRSSRPASSPRRIRGGHRRRRPLRSRGALRGRRPSRSARPAPSPTASRVLRRRQLLRRSTATCSSDVDLSALRASTHAAKGGMGTIFLTPVDDPRRYGLVEVRDGRPRRQLPRKAGGRVGERHRRSSTPASTCSSPRCST